MALLWFQCIGELDRLEALRRSFQTWMQVLRSKRVTRYEYYYFHGNCILISHLVPVAQNKNGIGYNYIHQTLPPRPMTSVCKNGGEAVWLARLGLPHCSCVAHVRDTSYENYTSGPSINRTDKRCPHIKSIYLLIAFHPRTCATQLQCSKSSVDDTDRQSIRSEIGGSIHPWGGGGGSIHTPGYLDGGPTILQHSQA